MLGFTTDQPIYCCAISAPTPSLADLLIAAGGQSGHLHVLRLRSGVSAELDAATGADEYRPASVAPGDTARAFATRRDALIDPVVLMQQLGEDEEFLAELAVDFREQRRQDSARFPQAIEARDWALVEWLADRFRDCALTLGAAPTVSAARRVSALARSHSGDQRPEDIAGAITDLESELDRLEAVLARAETNGFSGLVVPDGPAASS